MYSLVVGRGWFSPSIVMEFLHQETCGDFGSCAAPDFALVTPQCSSCAVWLTFNWSVELDQSNFWSNLVSACRALVTPRCSFCAVWSTFDQSVKFDWSNFQSNLVSVCRLFIDCVVCTVWPNFDWSIEFNRPVEFNWSNFRSNLGTVDLILSQETEDCCCCCGACISG